MRKDTMLEGFTPCPAELANRYRERGYWRAKTLSDIVDRGGGLRRGERATRVRLSAAGARGAPGRPQPAAHAGRWTGSRPGRDFDRPPAQRPDRRARDTRRAGRRAARPGRRGAIPAVG